MAHLLTARQSGAVAELKIALDKGAYSLVAEVQRWDEAKATPVRSGDRHFQLPANLFKAFTIKHLKERLGTILPNTTPGAEVKGTAVQEDTSIASIEGVTPTAGEVSVVYVIFNIDKSAPSADAASSSASQPGGLARAQSVMVKAGSGPISPDRELAVTLSIWLDSGNNYVTVQATNASQNINFEGKVSISDNYWTSVTVKELKRKFNGFPPTSDRGVLNAVSGPKTIKDTDKFAALGVKGKRGETLKFNVTFELAGTGNASGSSGPAAAPVATGEPAPEIDPKQQFNVQVDTSIMEGNVFLKLTCKSEVLPELHKSAALPKVTFSVFNLRDLHALLKGPQYPILQAPWAAFDNGNGKIKVSDLTSLSKLGVVATPNKTNTYNFTFIIDPHAALPNVDK